MKPKRFREGDLVVAVTVNRASGGIEKAVGGTTQRGVQQQQAKPVR